MLRTRSRRLSLFWGLFGLIFCLTVLAVTLPPHSTQSSRWYENAFFTILSPFERAATTISESVRHVVRRYIYLVELSAENQALTENNQQLEYRTLLFQKVMEENGRLRAMLVYKQNTPWTTMAAQVIAHNPRAEFRMLTINRGEKDGVRRRMPVVAPQGLVGQVYRVGPHASEVLLITDPTSAIDARINETGARGLIKGRVMGTEWQRSYFMTALEFVDRASLVRAGGLVMTTGLDGVFPEGIPIGEISQINEDEQGLFKEAAVMPKVELMAVRELLVITRWVP